MSIVNITDLAPPFGLVIYVPNVAALFALNGFKL